MIITIRIGGSASPKILDATTPRSSLIAAGGPNFTPGRAAGYSTYSRRCFLAASIEHGRFDNGRLLRVAVGQDQHAGPFGGRLHGFGRRGESRAAALLAADGAVQVVSRLAAENEPRRLFFRHLRHALLRQHQHGDAGHGDDRSADGPQAHFLAVEEDAEGQDQHGHGGDDRGDDARGGMPQRDQAQGDADERSHGGAEGEDGRRRGRLRAPASMAGQRRQSVISTM